MSLGDTIATSRTFAVKLGYQVDADRDLVGLGAAQAAAGLSGGFPVSSSASRTAVVEASGGRSQVANLVAAGVVALVLVFLAPVLEVLPKPALGAVILAAAIGLFDFGSLRRYYLQRRLEFWVAIATMLTVIFVDPLVGLILAIIISVVDVLRRVTRPKTAILGRLEASRSWQSVERYPTAVTQPGLIVYRVEAPLFFANAERIRQELEALVEANHGAIEWIVIDAEAITDIDLSAAEILSELDDSLAAARNPALRGRTDRDDGRATPGDGAPARLRPAADLRHGRRGRGGIRRARRRRAPCPVPPGISRRAERDAAGGAARMMCVGRPRRSSMAEPRSRQ